MTAEELKNFTDLYSKFNEDCKRVCRILAKKNSDYIRLEDFSLEDGDVKGIGEETWNYGGHETHTYYFDPKYLTMSNEELTAMVDDWIKKEKEKKLQLKIEDDERKKKEELELLKRLKEKYES